MKCKCPACGSQFSLDVLMQHEQASQAVIAALSLNGEFGRQAVQYLALFRPEKSALTMERVAKLLGLLLDDVKQQRICRGGVVYDAPMECWVDCLAIVLNGRHHLKLPLTSHNYLYEVMTKWQPRHQGNVAVMKAQTGTANKTTKALQNLAEFANG